jgi:hypothetical protein
MSPNMDGGSIRHRRGDQRYSGLVGRRLLLTSEGEQLLTGCRLLLNFASGVTEQAELLRLGDTGVLKIAGSPQHIESALLDRPLRNS